MTQYGVTFASNNRRRLGVCVPFLPLLAKAAVNVDVLSFAGVATETEFQAPLVTPALQMAKPNQRLATPAAFRGSILD